MRRQEGGGGTLPLESKQFRRFDKGGWRARCLEGVTVELREA